MAFYFCAYGVRLSAESEGAQLQEEWKGFASSPLRSGWEGEQSLEGGETLKCSAEAGDFLGPYSAWI